MIGALIGGIGSVVGGVLGAQAQSDAAAYNYYVNMLNYYQRERERQDRLREARRIEVQQQEGATDAEGNRTRYVPGKGWVVEQSDRSRLLSDAQRREQMEVLNKDLPLRRNIMQRNARMQDQDADMASVLLDRFRQGVEEDPEAMRRMIIGTTTRAINSEYDNLINTAARTATRQSSSNFGNILTSLARDRMGQISSAIANARLQAPRMAEQITQQREGQLLNQYNMLATRGSQMPGVSYQPQNVEGGLNNMMASFAGRSDKGAEMLMGAHKIAGGTYDYMQPNTGAASAVIGGANAVGSGLDRMFAFMQRQDAQQQRLAGGNDWG